MSPRSRRIVIPLIVIAVAFGVVLSMITRPSRTAPAPSETPAGSTDPDGAVATTDGDTPVEPANGAAGDAAGDAADGPAADGGVPFDLESLGELSAVAPDADAARSEPLGSIDYRTDRMQIEFADHAAGIERISFTDLWDTAGARREADDVKKRIALGTARLADLPADQRYVLCESEQLAEFAVPELAAHSIQIEGRRVSLFGDVWSATGPGRFVTEVRGADGTPVVRITRTFTLAPDEYDITLAQRVENLTDSALRVKWGQYGPGDLTVDRSRYMDRRRFRFGHLWSATTDPSRRIVTPDDDDMLFERIGVFKKWEKSQRPGLTPEEVSELRRLWPNKASLKNDLELSWFASTNRYFALAIHPSLGDAGTGSLALTDVVDEVLFQAWGSERDTSPLFTFLYSPEHSVDAGATLALDLGIFAGPMDRSILSKREPYAALNMRGLILYQMSSFCAVCTFQWLAEALLGFLSLLHNYVVFDWGIAIILLVGVVRTLLHPITKRSQINMQRFGKSMSAMKPELEKLQKKYANEPKKFQQEQLRLMREHGANPLQMLGCLPMFLQMPIWVALYAMLYFAVEIRHEPAFFGVFQLFWDWPFLADLSSADHFFGELDAPRRFLIWNVTGINILPLLMGVIFFIQQKYMSPPPSPTTTKEQLQQQKIMKIMMVVMFPLMLYSAPSGLTLYILTSSCIGILESRYIRRHIDEMDLKPQKPKSKSSKPKDAQGRAYAAALERAKSKRKPPPKTYKKRR